MLLGLWLGGALSYALHCMAEWACDRSTGRNMAFWPSVATLIVAAGWPLLGLWTMFLAARRLVRGW